jgi:hypothetical protein
MKEAIMEAPLMTPADPRVTDAYALFWDSVENDDFAGDDAPPADDAPADAYDRFWELSEV